MSPDERARWMHDDVVRPFDDAELDADLAALDAELDAELAKAGATLRRSHERDGRSRPSAAFAASLRERLLAEAALPPEPAAIPVPQPAAVRNETEADVTRRVHPQVRRRTPTILPAPRWSVLALAAVFVVALLGFNAGDWFSGPAPARATDVAGASLLRDGQTAALAAGTALAVGDEVRVADGGHATLAIGNGVMRLDAGAVVRLSRLKGDVAAEQVSGRVWHRVALAGGETYTVTTGAYRWTAVGTAFSLNVAAPGSEIELDLIAVEHAVDVAGPLGSMRVEQGNRAVIGAGVVRWGVGPALPEDLATYWLVANAQLDAAAGFTVGVLQSVIGSPTPGPSPSFAPGPPGPSDPAASMTPEPSGSAAPTDTPTPTVVPTSVPTPRPTPKPTPTVPPLGSIGASALACGETAIVGWSSYSSSRFAKLVVVQSATSFDVPDVYPPPAGISVVSGSATASAAASSIGVSLGTGNSAWYRVLALDSAKHVIAASPARKATAPGYGDLGPFVATPVTGGIEATWTPYAGPADCFVYYKLVWSASDPNPSYAGGVYDGYQVIGAQGDGALSFALAAGTYWMRIEAIRYADHGVSPIVVACSSPAVQVTVP